MDKCILKEHTAGIDEKVKWTNLTCGEIAILLSKQGFKVSRNIVRKLLEKHGYVKRKALKAGKETENRNAQFENIAKLTALYDKEGNPVISVDTKKKEKIANIFRNCKTYTTENTEVFYHDFP